MLQLLRNLNTDRESIEDLIALQAFGKSVVAEMESMQIDVPEWITDKMAVLKTEITARRQGEIQMKLRQAKSRLEAMATPDEKRAKLAAEIDRLQKLAAGA